MAEVSLDTSEIHDWDSFYAVCIAAFGFSDEIDWNLDAWVAALAFLDEPDNDSMFVLQPAERLVIYAEYFAGFLGGTPDIAADFLNSVAAVNQTYRRRGEVPRLALVLL